MSVRKRHLTIQPPLLNSANPWCTSLEQLQELYDCPYTGAVTTRTSLWPTGFQHNEDIHQFTFYNPSTHQSAGTNPTESGPTDQTGSLNTIGYSPLSLYEYVNFVQTISDGLPDAPSSPEPKPFIISVTGTVEDVAECYKLIQALQSRVKMQLAMEVNLSCPNILHQSPPAYDSTTLLSYINALKLTLMTQSGPDVTTGQQKLHVQIGIKTPPYTYHEQFKNLIDALLASSNDARHTGVDCPISFITATNTLGSSLLLTPSALADPAWKPEDQFTHTLKSATGAGIGGLAGAPLHPLALGNVYTIRQLLSQHEVLRDIQIIGVGGVEDVDGYRRMRAVGADSVGVGTALGRIGVKIFEQIGEGLQQH
ncbi:dihydroorotate dehydrogenase [Pleomassaria siparia CBS 279.74]|uniref:Dihydroorotate dehydrogenase (fumarate) n=1 Tax=Pleomassaria siparia CBS 279.74 TaxID=1314801 RepID=A0A6G1K217_9PLEO|nr:dihydroorotate dehydrogenase [Pleomassaria siparia CBS 279.74]